MAYTVKRVAAMSGVSGRTLRFYDQTGLLKHSTRSLLVFAQPQPRRSEARHPAIAHEHGQGRRGPERLFFLGNFL
jgi:hypothetical protein